jgi:hypothetical protein
MKNKTIVIVSIVLGIVLAVFIGVYLIGQNESPKPGGTASDTEINDQKDTEQPQNKLVTDDFEVNLPAGWQQTTPAMGTSAMAINSSERIDDPPAQKINFKSYFAVSYDTLQDKSLNEYLQLVKSGLQQTISGVVFTKDQDTTINGKFAHIIEAELTQQGVNFKILMVIITGQGKDVWTMSFNTTKSGWDGYEETFYSVANSFNLKK